MDILDHGTVETPVGKMQLIASPTGLCALEFIKADRQDLLDARLSKRFKFEKFFHGENKYISATLNWLTTYFKGDFAGLFDIPLDLRGTDFELRVWDELKKINLGQTISYGELAIRIGNPKAQRAVGGASRRNPVSIIVPCHRVIGSSGKLTGYGGGLPQKEWLIGHESSQSFSSQNMAFAGRGFIFDAPLSKNNGCSIQ